MFGYLFLPASIAAMMGGLLWFPETLLMVSVVVLIGLLNA